MPSGQKYKNHPLFSDLNLYEEFYESLASIVFPYSTMGTMALGNIDSYVLTSIQGTLKSMKTILLNGMINDAYALLRKYYDAVIISIYSNLYLEEHFSTENFIVKKIDDWLKGKDRLPEYRVMSDYIRKSSRVVIITQILFSDKRYRILRDRCNDHTHYNFYHNLLLNDPDIHLSERTIVLDDFAKDLRDVIILHTSYLFFAKQHYMSSTDYINSIECGLAPEPDSQYWVAPFVQKLFDEVIKKYRPDLAATIKEHTYMNLK